MALPAGKQPANWGFVAKIGEFPITPKRGKLMPTSFYKTPGSLKLLANYWVSPETSSINRLPMLNLEHLEKIALDANWRFQLLASPTQPLTKKWSSIPVPGLWTMQPPSEVFFDRPIYTNVQMPYDELPPNVPSLNPTGVYERDFELPKGWDRRRTVLHLGGWESVAYILINEKEVGMSKDSRLAAEFDVTAFVKPGKNTIRIHVTKWSDANYIEDQDQWWHGGITRSVKLYVTNEVFIERLYTTSGLKSDFTTGTLQIEAHIASLNNRDISGYSLRARILELPKAKGAQLSATLESHVRPNWTEMTEEHRIAGRDFFHGEFWDGKIPAKTLHVLHELEPPTPGKILLKTEIPSVSPWSAESPKLYTLSLELLDPAGVVIEVSNQRIGFRDVRVVGKHLLFNGEKVIIYGVNRHDFNRLTGRVVTREDMRQDLLEMKRWNFNAVRTSHYPNDPAFLDLCDELGFYVIDEANIESHAFYDSICNDPRYLGAFVERVGRMMQRDIHHPSVIFWSLGNESGAGLNHAAAAAYARAFDTSRPLHYEGAIRGDWRGGHSLTDVVAPMYPTIKAIVSYAKSGRQDRPLIMCEYSHAMGNSNGTLAEYWEEIHSIDGLQGGFIWEFWDHGPDQVLPDGTHRAAYGGDFGEKKHDGNFCCDGMVFPDRTPKPAMREFKEIAAPISISTASAKTGEFQIFNKQFFSDLSEYEINWSTTRDGLVVEAGKLAVPKTAPRKSSKVTIKSPLLAKADGRGERFITFTFIRRQSTAWSPASSEVGWNQFALPSRALQYTSPNKPPMDLREIVDASGAINIPFMKVAPVLSLWRAPTDNDRIGHIATKWQRWGVRDLTRTDCVFTSTVNQIKIKNIWQTSTGINIKHTQIVIPEVDGFTVKESVLIPKELNDLARIGTNFELADDLNTLTWFGTGAHETYPDRKIGRVHRWLSSVADQYIPYVRPQENGGHNGVRWFELTKASGEGVRFDCDIPRQVSVTPNRATMLADATHDVEVRPSGNVVVHIDAAHRGLGTASCGPDTIEKYFIATGVHEWQWRVRTI